MYSTRVGLETYRRLLSLLGALKQSKYSVDCRTVLHTSLAHFLKQLLVIYMDSFLIWIVSPDFSHIIRNTVFWTSFHSVADIFVVAIHFVVLCFLFEA